MIYYLIIVPLFIVYTYYNISDILWNINKLVTTLEKYFLKENTGVKINSIINIENNKNLTSKFLIKNNLLYINDDFNKILVKYQINQEKYRIILNNTSITKYLFKEYKIKPKVILSAEDQNKRDITNILNEYSGPERNFYIKNIKLEISDILKDDELSNLKYIKIIDNNIDEYLINVKNNKYLLLNNSI